MRIRTNMVELLVDHIGVARAGDHDPMYGGFLVAVVDWFSRRVLAWGMSIKVTTDFCVEALNEALTRFGKLEISNTYQGSQFASTDFTLVQRGKIAISMNGKACWRDDVFVERLDAR